jgi:hypothetical protein
MLTPKQLLSQITAKVEKTARQPLYLGRMRTGQERVVYSGGGRSSQQSQRQKFLSSAACNRRRAKTALIAFLVIFNARLHHKTHWQTFALAPSTGALSPLPGAVSEHGCC